MKCLALAIFGAALVPLGASAQPLEQNFAFGAPPSVLGNDRIGAARLGRRTPAVAAGKARRDVRVGFGRAALSRRSPVQN